MTTPKLRCAGPGNRDLRAGLESAEVGRLVVEKTRLHRLLLLSGIRRSPGCRIEFHIYPLSQRYLGQISFDRLA